jgi:hypothetical protein
MERLDLEARGGSHDEWAQCDETMSDGQQEALDLKQKNFSIVNPQSRDGNKIPN